MSKKPGPNHSRAFKDEVALVAVKRKKTLAELVQLSQPDDPVEGPTPRRPGGGAIGLIRLSASRAAWPSSAFAGAVNQRRLARLDARDELLKTLYRTSVSRLSST